MTSTVCRRHAGKR